jgi:hypothetical protein
LPDGRSVDGTLNLARADGHEGMKVAQLRAELNIEEALDAIE